MTTRKSDELLVIVKTYDLILWSSNPKSRFPRNHRFVLGERIERAVVNFHFGLERELWTLHRELGDGTYSPGPYKEFYVHEPKKRLISAAPYRDNVVHHALTQILAPLFERTFISDSYACRVGKSMIFWFFPTTIESLIAYVVASEIS